MHKDMFLSQLRAALSDLPEEDTERFLEYYAEMVDDQIEEGVCVEDAVDSLGSIEEIAAQIRMELPLPKLVRAKVAQRKFRAWEIALLCIGSPVWLPLLLAVLLCVLTVYWLIWIMILVLYVTTLVFAAGCLLGIAGAILTMHSTDILHAAFLLGSGLICATFSILLFITANRACKGWFRLSKKIVRNWKNKLSGKGSAQ